MKPRDVGGGAPASRRWRALRDAWALATPGAALDDALDDARLEAAIDVLRRQDASVMAVLDARPGLGDRAPLREAAGCDRARFERERAEFGRLLGAFEAAGVRTMLFKSVGRPPSFPYLSSNLDVLVPDADTGRARRVLREAGYVELVNVEEPRKFLFRRFPGDGTSYAFHLHGAVGWGVPFVPAAAMWSGARPAPDDPDVCIPGPREALLVTLAHWFYEDKALTLGNLLATAHAVAAFEEPLEEAAQLAAHHGWSDGFWGALEVFERAHREVAGASGLGEARARTVAAALDRRPAMRRTVRRHVRIGPDLPAVVPFVRNKIVYYRKVLRDPTRSRARRARDVIDTLLWAVRWKLHVRSQRPMLVALSGCDGSGKTLQHTRLCAALETCDVRYRATWWRGGSSRAFSALVALGRRVLPSRGPDAASAPGEETPPEPGGAGAPARDEAASRVPGDDAASDAASPGGSGGATGEAARVARRRREVDGPVRRALFALAWALDLFGPLVVRPRRLLAAGYVVVADRYVVDALVDFAVLTGGDPRRPPLPLRVVAALAPRPHVEIVLDVEPHQALARRPEEGDVTHLEVARAGYRAWAAHRGAHVTDAHADPGAIAADVARRVLDRFAARYGTVINALLRSNPVQLNPGEPR